MKLLENKKALITGGSRGIGRAIAIAYAKQGADVAISDLMVDEDAIDVVKEIESYGVKGKAYASDASSNEASESLINEVVKDFGQIDILVNNAGITRDNLLLRMSEQDWDLVIKVNLKSIFNMTKAVQRVMLKPVSYTHLTLPTIYSV